MRSVVIGMGEVGSSLYNILSRHYFVSGTDKNNGIVSSSDFFNEAPEIIHICFPYSENFIEQVKVYQEKYKPKFTIIHSTVPVGTSSQVGAIHSPIRGLHPNLESGILTFPKFLGGKDASLVADYFRRADIKVVLFDKPETTEALKLFDTEYYRTCVEFAHRVKNFCNKHDLNFSEVYTIPNISYNEGYQTLGFPEYTRPILQPIMKEIGGHCLLPNKEIIKMHE